MFESNLLSQINTRSPLPTFVEVEVVQSINSSLQRLFQFAHAALAEKSDLAARLQPWTDELFYVGVAVIERMLVFNADTTVAELLFELRRGRLSGPCAMPPRHAKPFRGEHLRFLLFGPAPAPSPELQSMGLVNSPSVSHSQAGLAKDMAQLASPVDNTPEIVGLHDATATPSMDVADSPGGADMHVEELYSSTHASYGHLRLQPLSRHQQIISLLLLTLKPYLEKKASEWYLRETDPSPDAVAIRQSYARRYPSRAELIRLLVRFVYPAYHVISESANFLFKFLFLLELTPFYSPWHRIFGIVVRRSTMKDSMLVSSGPARRACLLARMIVLLIVVGFRLLDFTRGSSSSSGSSPQAMGINEDLPIPPPPVWGVDAPLPIAEGSLPEKGCCPICRQRVQNASVCTSSGVVCCYPCLQAYLREHQSCPVTGKSASLENIRRVYEC